jgi:peptidoglycan/LPS O-acetylase OafA/YrhL
LGYAIGFASAGLTYGHQAVLLFFLISGFCIHFRQARATAREENEGGIPRSSLDIRSYAFRRFRRLYPPLVLALALTAGLDYLGTLINPEYYAGHSPYPFINAAVAGSHAVGALVGNLLFQGGLVSPIYGTDGPLWSLSYEFWFYVLYPVLLLVSVRLGARMMMAAAGASSLICLVLLHLGWVPDWLVVVPAYWVVWAGGAMIAEAYVGRTSLRGLRWLGPAAAAGLVGLAALTAVRRLGALDGEIFSPPLDVLWGFGLGVLLAYAMLAPTRLIRRLAAVATRFLSPLSAISYSLYLVHFPWLALVSAWWLSSHERLPVGAELAVAGVASSLAVAGVCWFLVERHFMSKPTQRTRPQPLTERLSRAAEQPSLIT